jgi:hypothetical protein
MSIRDDLLKLVPVGEENAVSSRLLRWTIRFDFSFT